MDKMKLLIADGAEEFRTILAKALKDTYHVQVAKEGQEALALMQSFAPNILVLDMMLPGLDGISLLQKTAQLGIHPVVLATTRLLSDYMTQMLERMGVGYVMVKPCDIRAVAERVGDLSQSGKTPLFTEPDPWVLTTNLLRDLGIPTKLKGYSFLREAIEIFAADPGQSITKELYCTVGQRCNATVTQVERGIRTAISFAWERRDSYIWRQFFLAEEGRGAGRPTNGAFISRLADHLAMETHRRSPECACMNQPDVPQEKDREEDWCLCG